MDYVEVYDINRKKLAILENVLGITEEIPLNAVGSLKFNLPRNDPKLQYCKERNLVKYHNVVYRILEMEAKSTDLIMEVTCEHIMCKLLDSVLLGYHVVGNLGVYTPDVINYILQGQSDFVLKTCEFNHQFEYGWEQENRLTALFNVPSRFTEPYRWEFNTAVFPYEISLRKIELNTGYVHYIRDRYNLMELTKKLNTTNLCTKLYPLGAGEGINQLKIDGDFIQSSDNVIQKYGIIERIWIDRRYTDKQSLLEASQAMLRELEQPYVEYAVDSALINSTKQISLGDRVRIIDESMGEDFSTFVTKIVNEYGNINTTSITIANKPEDIANSIADLADRQRIEMSYSQGATQIYTQCVQDNCDSVDGCKLNFYVPQDAKIINKVVAKITLSQFRAYSSATDGGGYSSSTTSSGGGSQTTSSSGGQRISSTESVRSVVKSTTSVELPSRNMFDDDDGGYNNNNHNHGIGKSTKLAIYSSEPPYVAGYAVWTPSGAHGHGDHEHDITIPSHSHDIDIEKHTHEVEIPNHQHNFSVPSHTHKISPKIYKFGSPNGFNLYVGNTSVGWINKQDYEIDITDYLVGSDGLIPRGNWLTIEARPNDLAYISISLSFQGYIQSRGNKTV